MKRSFTHQKILACLTLFFLSCSSLSQLNLQEQDGLEISKNKSVYLPGEGVELTISVSENPPESLTLSFYHLGNLLEKVVREKTEYLEGEFKFLWQPPNIDFRGYLIQVEAFDGEGKLLGHKTMGVDVSSDWSRFPRYGYLSRFPAPQYINQESLFQRLNRFHLNALQFYDWHHRHERPYSPDATWEDLARRTIHRQTIINFLQEAKQHGMISMAYNLIHGSLTPLEEASGLTEDMGLFIREGGEITGDFHPLPSSWLSDKLYLTNPANLQWQEFISQEMFKVFQSQDLPFDGWHMDTLGNRSWGERVTVDAWGNALQLNKTYSDFITAMRTESFSDPNRSRIVFNTVSLFGHQELANHPDLDILYAELWDAPQESTYNALFQIFEQKEQLTNKAMVIAGYINEKWGERVEEPPGSIHSPSLFLAQSAIFALGGSHIGVGDTRGFLISPYFPNKNLQLSPGQEAKLMDYYDYLVAYQNLLRDNTQMGGIQWESTNYPANSNGQPAQLWIIPRETAAHEIIQVINLLDTENELWRDPNALSGTPQTRRDVEIQISKPSGWEESMTIYWASPDYQGGLPQILAPNQIQRGADGRISLKLPYLEYWSSIWWERP